MTPIQGIKATIGIQYTRGDESDTSDGEKAWIVMMRFDTSKKDWHLTVLYLWSDFDPKALCIGVMKID